MKQILQNIKNGRTELVDVPLPLCRPGHVLIASRASLISVGTERMLVDFGKAGWFGKARQQPEKVRQVLDKLWTDGVLPTIEAVFNKLDETLPLGYCNAGVVLEVGGGIKDLNPGDRVASNGAHAEVVCVPRNLCAKIPERVSDEDAAFTVLGSIALQGVRLAVPTLGERFMVFGLGLVGLLTVQFLRASGCTVLATDVREERLRLAEVFGAETLDLRCEADAVTAAMAWTAGRGVDGVIIAASAKGDEIIHQAARVCRKRGRIILVGVVDLNLRRGDFYEKELTFQVSCSYGPGRYDEKYEQAGQDYPIGFVRWTEQRNFEAVLEAMRSGQLRLAELITRRLKLTEAVEAYDRILHDPVSLGIVIGYPDGGQQFPHAPIILSPAGTSRPSHRRGQDQEACRIEKRDILRPAKGDPIKVGVIGAGNYARSILLPALSRTGAALGAIADINGAAATHAARKFGAEKAISDSRQILDDPEIQAVFVLVGHHLHAGFVCQALEAGKHVFVEKPLAINGPQLESVSAAYEMATVSEARSFFPEAPAGGRGTLESANTCAADSCGESGPARERPLVMVGFNRRFSAHIVKAKELLAGLSGPLCMTLTVNAGSLPPEHWTRDPERGGGRIVGEGCHFIDLLSHLAGSPVVSVAAMMVGGNGPLREDQMSILLRFVDGSVGSVHYFANGARSFPKETLEVFGDGRVIRVENFRVTVGFGFKGFRSFRTWRQDKGHRAEIAAFMDRVAAGGPPLIPFDQIVNVTQASFAALESARKGEVIHLPQ